MPSLPPLTNLLDVREDPGGRFVEGAANIPWSELPRRLSELPSSASQLLIADLGQEATEALAYLNKGGRNVLLTQDFRFSPEPQLFRLWQPNPFLLECLPQLTPGNAVDLGCGAGREAVALACFGWQVEAIDILPDALLRAKDLARRYSVEEQILFAQRPTDLQSAQLLCAFFFFDREILTHAVATLPVGAAVIMEVFTEEHARRFGKPGPERFVREQELLQLFRSLDGVHCEEALRSSSRHTARFFARKSAKS